MRSDAGRWLLGVWLLALLLGASVVRGDVVGDEVDDLMTASAGSNFFTTSAGTIFVTTRHGGTLDGTSSCMRDTIIGPSNTTWGLGAEAAPDVWAAKNFDGTTDCATGTFSTGLDDAHLAPRRRDA